MKKVSVVQLCNYGLGMTCVEGKPGCDQQKFG